MAAANEKLLLLYWLPIVKVFKVHTVIHFHHTAYTGYAWIASWLNKYSDLLKDYCNDVTTIQLIGTAVGSRITMQ